MSTTYTFINRCNTRDQRMHDQIKEHLFKRLVLMGANKVLETRIEEMLLRVQHKMLIFLRFRPEHFFFRHSHYLGCHHLQIGKMLIIKIVLVIFLCIQFLNFFHIEFIYTLYSGSGRIRI